MFSSRLWHDRRELDGFYETSGKVRVLVISFEQLWPNILQDVCVWLCEDSTRHQGGPHCHYQGG